MTSIVDDNVSKIVM